MSYTTLKIDREMVMSGNDDGKVMEFDSKEDALTWLEWEGYEDWEESERDYQQFEWTRYRGTCWKNGEIFGIVIEDNWGYDT